MGEYIKKKKDMKFQSQDALKTVQSVIDEANEALNDRTRTIAKSAIPEVLAGALGAGVASHVKNKKLKEAKELCYREAVRKQNAIIKALKNESDADKERIDYLNSLNTLLQSAIKDLEYDLGMSY